MSAAPLAQLDQRPPQLQQLRQHQLQIDVQQKQQQAMIQQVKFVK